MEILKIHTMGNVYHFKPMVLGEVLPLPLIQFQREYAPMSYMSYAEALSPLEGDLLQVR